MRRIASAGAMMAGVVLAIVSGIPLRADEPEGRDIPPAFATLEYLVGKWNGQASPKDDAQRFRGWPETHTWAWSLTKGKPTAMTLAIEGGKLIANGRLSFDPARKRYRLEGSGPWRAGRFVFEGTLDRSGKTLVLDHVSPEKGEAVRIALRPNANFIRYTMTIDRKEAGAVQFRHATEIGLTREGESLAGGSSAAERPKCIVTGGAAALTISYQGQTFPICCTGCKDEFNENPQKYIKKAALMAQSRGQAKAGSSRPAAVSKFEDAFAGDVADPPAKTSARKPAPAKPASGDEAGGDESKFTTSTAAARAAGLLRIGHNLEKSGKTRAALENYRRIVKDFDGTPAATTARQRIKALD